MECRHVRLIVVWVVENKICNSLSTRQSQVLIEICVSLTVVRSRRIREMRLQRYPYAVRISWTHLIRDSIVLASTMMLVLGTQVKLHTNEITVPFTATTFETASKKIIKDDRW